MKAIIYSRKSTDRADRQQLSVENQVEEALKIAQREGLEVVEVIRENKSAKDPGRPEFNRMMKMITQGKATCIITWKLNRLARNPIDEGSIKWSLQSGLIKAIYTQGEVFRSGDNVLIMGMHFGMSTQYILDLKADSHRGVKRKISEGGVCQRAPLGYLNDVATKTIKIDPIKSKWIQEMFHLRSQHLSYPLIVQTLFKKGITRPNGKPFSETTLENILHNKFYIGIVKRFGEEYRGNFPPLISLEMFESVQNLGKGFHFKQGIEKKCYFKGFLKDNNGLVLSGYEKKGISYYKTSTRSSERINISQRKIFEYFETEFQEFEMKKELIELNQAIILEVVEKRKPNKQNTLGELQAQIHKLEERRAELINLRLDGELDKEVFLERKNEFTRQIHALENRKNTIKNDDIEKRTKKMFELSENLYQSYKRANEEQKSVLLRKLMFELLVKNKKELSYADNSLYSGLKMLQKYDFSNLEAPSGVEPD